MGDAITKAARLDDATTGAAKRRYSGWQHNAQRHKKSEAQHPHVERHEAEPSTAMSNNIEA